MTNAHTATPTHSTEADCAGLLADDDCCTVCGVSHANPCPDCGARGYHLATCPEMADDDGPACERCGKHADAMTTLAFAPFCSAVCSGRWAVQS